MDYNRYTSCMRAMSKGDILISDFEYNLTAPGCHPSAGATILHLLPREDILEVLPYLNAELEGAQYYHSAGVLIWKGGDPKYAFRSREITISPVAERGMAEAYCRKAVELVNSIWSRREEIEPDFSRVELPRLMDIYKKLPRTNCRECGYPTCMAFAAAYREDPSLQNLCGYL